MSGGNDVENFGVRQRFAVLAVAVAAFAEARAEPTNADVRVDTVAVFQSFFGNRCRRIAPNRRTDIAAGNCVENLAQSVGNVARNAGLFFQRGVNFFKLCDRAAADVFEFRVVEEVCDFVFCNLYARRADLLDVG